MESQEVGRGDLGLSALLGAETGPRPRRAHPPAPLVGADGSKATARDLCLHGRRTCSTCSPTAMNTSSSDVAVTERRRGQVGSGLQPPRRRRDACPGCVGGVGTVVVTSRAEEVEEGGLGAVRPVPRRGEARATGRVQAEGGKRMMTKSSFGVDPSSGFAKGPFRSPGGASSSASRGRRQLGTPGTCCANSFKSDRAPRPRRTAHSKAAATLPTAALALGSSLGAPLQTSLGSAANRSPLAAPSKRPCCPAL